MPRSVANGCKPGGWLEIWKNILFCCSHDPTRRINWLLCSISHLPAQQRFLSIEIALSFHEKDGPFEPGEKPSTFQVQSCETVENRDEI